MLNYNSFQPLPVLPGNDLASEIATCLALGCSVQFKPRRNFAHLLLMIVHHPDMKYPVFMQYDLLNPAKSLQQIKETRQSLLGLARIEKKII